MQNISASEGHATSTNTACNDLFPRHIYNIVPFKHSGTHCFMVLTPILDISLTHILQVLRFNL
jgi:hypothetical protein